MKFGGTSVAAPDAIEKVGRIVRRLRARRPVVVVSALAGVTDDLLAAASAAAAGRARESQRLCERLSARHAKIARRLALDGAVTRDLQATLDELRDVLHGVALLREPSPRSLDLAASFGERLSARLLAGHLESAGVPARFADARDFVTTDDAHGTAQVDLKATARRARARLQPLIRQGLVPVVTGFIGRSHRGATTTLGRSGSDYTAALLGEALRADEVWIWKEVDGVCTADPDVVPQARVVRHLSYGEAAEMAHFGAEVIHPRTMQPARRAGLSIRIKNTFRPTAPGTLVGPRARRDGPLLVSSLDGLALVTIEGSGIFGQPGMVLRLLSPVALAGANIYMISMSSSEYNLSFAIRQADVERSVRALDRDLRAQGLLGEPVRRLGRSEAPMRLVVERGMALVSVVGARMKGQRGIAGRIFSALGERGVNVVAIAQGSSEYNITVIVRAADVRTAVRAVHDRVNRGR